MEWRIFLKLKNHFLIIYLSMNLIIKYELPAELAMKINLAPSNQNL